MREHTSTTYSRIAAARITAACLALASIFAGLTRPAAAATIIEQEVATQSGEHKTTYRHIWTIDDKRFSLKVTSEGSESRYLFNGRTLYVCGKVKKQQEQALQDLHNKELLSSLRQGACQAVPTNFMTRFFLTPIAAIGTIDPDDGLRLNLGLDNYKLTAASAQDRTMQGDRTVQGAPCRAFRRQMHVRKDTAAAAGKKATFLNYDEELCVGQVPAWRDGLWTEVAKLILRQPQGSKLMRQLKQDQDQLKGPILDYKATISSVSPGADKQPLLLTAKTTAIKTGAVRPESFKLPEGYSVFDQTQLEMKAQASASGAKSPAQVKVDDSADEAGELSVKDQVLSVFFCAIAGAIGCLGQ